MKVYASNIGIKIWQSIDEVFDIRDDTGTPDRHMIRLVAKDDSIQVASMPGDMPPPRWDADMLEQFIKRHPKDVEKISGMLDGKTYFLHRCVTQCTKNKMGLWEMMEDLGEDSKP